MNKSGKIKIIDIIKTMIPMVVKACPLYFGFFCIVSLLTAALSTMNTVTMNNFLDSIEKFFNKTCTFYGVCLELLFLGICLISYQAANGVMNFIGDDFSTKVEGKIREKINIKSSKINPTDFENPLFLDDINKAEEGTESGIFIVRMILVVSMFYIPYFVFIGIYLYKLRPVLVISIALIFFPIMISQVIKIKLFTNLEDEIAPIRRQFKYYERCLIDKEYYKETRSLGCAGYFMKLYKESLSKYNEYTLKIQKRDIKIEICLKLFTLSGYIIVLFILIDSMLKKYISIGAFGAVCGVLITFVNRMQELICKHISSIMQHIGTQNNLIRFLSAEERTGKDAVINDDPSIRLDNVSFTYPGTTSDALADINLYVNPGETIALVGENGSGKSTLIKILIGLYIPSNGDVEIAGYNTKEVSIKSLSSIISGVFQKYQRYKMTLKENIVISDTISDVNEKRVRSAAKEADLEMRKVDFSDGYDTMLSREFDGVELSGGQWQRVALARGFYKLHNMIILDEPTAAIDPIEETKLYNKFQKISKDKTSFIVTHRLGSAKLADRIIVLDKGRIVQQGTHESLINQEGKYREMYNLQSKWYK